MTVYTFLIENTPQIFQKINFSIYPNILYIYDQNFMLVPTIKLLEFSDKNWETYERLLNFWSIFWLFFLLSKVSKMKFYQKSLIYKKYNIVRHWFSSKNWIFAIFFKKVSIDGFTHYLWKILLIFIVQSFKNEISSKSLIHKNTTLYDIDFLKKLDFFDFFLRKFLLTVLHIFLRKYTPIFQKINFSIYPNILYIYDQNFMLVPTIKLLEFSD